MEVKKSHRGFLQYPEFTDMRGSTVSVTESSNINGGIWIFCKDSDGEDDTPHLNRTQAKQLIATLKEALKRQTFAEDTGDEE